MFIPKKTLALVWLLQSSLAYQWPSPQYDALETFLYQGQRSDGSNLASLVHPCRKRTGTMASVAAEWLRFVCFAISSRGVRSLIFSHDRHSMIWPLTMLMMDLEG